MTVTIIHSDGATEQVDVADCDAETPTIVRRDFPAVPLRAKLSDPVPPWPVTYFDRDLTAITPTFRQREGKK
jgi:hypothetical protein